MKAYRSFTTDDGPLLMFPSVRRCAGPTRVRLRDFVPKSELLTNEIMVDNLEFKWSTPRAKNERSTNEPRYISRRFRF